MENAVMMRALSRVDRFDKRPHKVLRSACDELSSLLTRIKKRGKGIVEPQHLLEDITSMMNESTTALANEDFIDTLRSIREAIVLHFGVAFALHLGGENWGFVLINDDSLEDVETLEESNYSKFRRESMNGNEGAEEFLQHVEESLGAVMQHVVENPILVIQSVEGPSERRHARRKEPPPVIKKMKQ